MKFILKSCLLQYVTFEAFPPYVHTYISQILQCFLAEAYDFLPIFDVYPESKLFQAWICTLEMFTSNIVGENRKELDMETSIISPFSSHWKGNSKHLGLCLHSLSHITITAGQTIISV